GRHTRFSRDWSSDVCSSDLPARHAGGPAVSTLECRAVTAGYIKERPCVRSVDLTLEPGEITCLLGPNGAGKTTLLDALAGLLPRSGGEVRVRGAEVRSARPREAVRAGMVLVPDDRALFRKLTTRQNLLL